MMMRISFRRAGIVMKIRIGHLSTFYHTAILLMAKGDADRRLGITVDWKLMGTGPEIMKAFRQKELDLAYIGLPPALIGISQGTDVLCVAGGHMEGTVMAGKSTWRSFPEANDLRSVLDQFQGGKIGVPGKGSIHDVILKESIEQNGLEGRIEVINYPWADLVTEAVVTGEVSAAFGTPALAIAIERFAGGKILYPPSMLWPDNPSYGIVADIGFLQKESEIVKTFLVLHEEATAFIRNEPREAARIIADYVGIIDRRFVLDTIKVSPKYCAQLTERYIASTMRFVPVLRKLGYIQDNVAPDRIFSRRMIDLMHPEKDHYGDGIAPA
jgi:NitT/TauT family transport system substrate-binding protein